LREKKHLFSWVLYSVRTTTLFEPYLIFQTTSTYSKPLRTIFHPLFQFNHPRYYSAIELLCEYFRWSFPVHSFDGTSCSPSTAATPVILPWWW
jgi:hypothetical protein